MNAETTPTFELVLFDHGCAIVAMHGAGCLSAMHEIPIPERAARWMLRDLEAEPERFRDFGEDCGLLYGKASELLSVLDFNRSPQDNALEIAKALVRGPSPSQEDVDAEMPF